MNFIFGADVVVAQSEYGTTMLFDNSVTLPNSKIFSAFISVLYAVALVVYMKKSRLGRAIRATAQNARAAKILGVDTEKVYAATFGINAALCGISGDLISITILTPSLLDSSLISEIPSILFSLESSAIFSTNLDLSTWYGISETMILLRSFLSASMSAFALR